LLNEINIHHCILLKVFTIYDNKGVGIRSYR